MHAPITTPELIIMFEFYYAIELGSDVKTFRNGYKNYRSIDSPFCRFASNQRYTDVRAFGGNALC